MQDLMLIFFCLQPGSVLIVVRISLRNSEISNDLLSIVTFPCNSCLKK